MAQLEAAKKLHDEDIAAGFAGVFLEDRLEKKYSKAAKDFIWQWFFPRAVVDVGGGHEGAEAVSSS